ncbi:hypothetical protein VB741_24810 [Leptothoe sp. PORK10 BA2]|nr:hypothetical protein [Leptothoe sp. PORK10 BA2]
MAERDHPVTRHRLPSTHHQPNRHRPRHVLALFAAVLQLPSADRAVLG